MERSQQSVETQSQKSKFPTLVHQVWEDLEENYNLNIPSVCVPFLCRCLKQKNENVPKTIKLILAFQKVLTDFDNWNSTLTPSLYSDLYTQEISYFNPLSQRDDGGRHVFLFRPEVWDPQKVSFDEIITCLWMFLQYANAYVEDIRKNGWVAIFDFNNSTLEQGFAMSLSKMLALTKWGQNGIVGKMKAVHVVNHPGIVDMLYAGCKPFLSDKIKNRILLHKNVEDLLEHVPARILPSYLKGNAEEDSYRDKTLLYELIEQDKYFKDMVKYGFPTK